LPMRTNTVCSIEFLTILPASRFHRFHGLGKMKKLFLYITITFILAGCAQLDQAGEYVLKEVSSINDNPESHEERRALPDDSGEDVKANKETPKE